MEREEFSERSEEFRDKILKAFDYLSGGQGFKIAYQRDVGRGERCIIVLQSAECQLRFIYDRGGIEVSVGDVEVRRRWDAGDPARREWYGLTAVIDFVNGRSRPTIDEAVVRSKEEWELSDSEYLRHLAGLLHPVLREVCLLFGRNGEPERRRAFEQYLSSPPPP